MGDPYDINLIFAEMEQELIKSYHRNMIRHAEEEVKEGFRWDMWQLRKLQDLAQYKKESRIIIDKHTKQAKDKGNGLLIDSYKNGSDSAAKILMKLEKDVDAPGNFFSINRRKVDALIDAMNNDFDTAGNAALRLTDDSFKRIIYKSQLMYGAGVNTLPKAIDMAAKDFLSAGINCIQYKNGSQVNIASYTEMYLRTSSKKAYFTGEGAKQAEWGEYLTQITSYGACSPICQPWQGRVYVNDVYAGGQDDGKHPLLSTAMDNGLFHPNCRHTSQPYFEGISSLPIQQDKQQVQETYAAEQKQRGIERNIRQYKRLSTGSLDPDNKNKYNLKTQEWQKAMREHIDENPFLRRNPLREKAS